MPYPPDADMLRGSAGESVEGPESPPIPSFDSLRGPHRRSAVDVLVPDGGAGPAPADLPAGPRPAEYADLVHLSGRLLAAAAAVPVRVACWSVGVPARCLRRLLTR